jgi:hypothetical protein
MDYYRQINRRDLTKVEQLFLSSENICMIHDAIIRQIHMVTGNTIYKQDDQDLLFFMYETLEIYTSHVFSNTQQHLNFLNTHLLEICGNRIVNEMIMQNQYIKDASKLPELIPRATATTNQRFDDRSISF